MNVCTLLLSLAAVVAATPAVASNDCPPMTPEQRAGVTNYVNNMAFSTDSVLLSEVIEHFKHRFNNKYLNEEFFAACAPSSLRGIEVLKRREEMLKAETKERQDRENSPKYVLTSAYVAYITVRKCHELRRGYASVFISDAEIKRAREAASSIEGALLKTDPALNKDELWEQAQKEQDQPASRMMMAAGRDWCQLNLMNLENQHKKLVPSAASVRKDF